MITRMVWRDEIDYTCFLIAAKTGMRRGEVLALRWKNVDFEKIQLLYVKQERVLMKLVYQNGIKHDPSICQKVLKRD